MGDLNKYLNEVGDLGFWRGGVDPVELGTQTAEDFIAAGLEDVFGGLPPGLRSLLVETLMWASSLALDAVGGIVNAGMSAAGGAAQAVPLIGAVVEAMFEAPQLIIEIGLAMRKANDQRRFDGRVDMIEDLADRRPIRWAVSHYTVDIPRYRRDVAFVRKSKDPKPLVWPPDSPGMLLQTGDGPRQSTGDCGAGHTQHSGGMDGSCHGQMNITALFFPVWWNRATDYGGFWIPTMDGKQGTQDDPNVILMALQTGLLTQPILNFQADGRDVMHLWHRLLNRWSRRMNEPMGVSGKIDEPGMIVWGALSENGIGGKHYGFKIDPEFNVDWDGGIDDHFYYTEDRLIASYQAGTDDPRLDNVGVYSWANEYVYSRQDGNYISASTYNAIAAATATFFSIRAAFLRKQSFCVAIRDKVPELLDPAELLIPEKSVRKAILACADGETLSETQIEVLKAKRIPPKRMRPKRAGRRRAAKAAPVLVVAGVALGLVYALKAK